MEPGPDAAVAVAGCGLDDSAISWCRLVTLQQPVADRPLFDG